MCVISYNRDQLLDLARVPRRYSKPNNDLFTTLKNHNLLNYRGTRGGGNYVFRSWDNNEGVNFSHLRTLPEAISTVTLNNNNDTLLQSESDYTCNRIKTLTKIECEPTSLVIGQKKLNICCINPRSVKNKTLAICDFIRSNGYDLVAITETWLGTSIDKVCLNELLPEGYQIKHAPRPGGRGYGGVAVIYRSNINVQVLTSTQKSDYSTFEHLDCKIIIKNYSMRLAVVYRPPPSKGNGLKTSSFLEEWIQFLAQFAVTDRNIIITGDLNFHLDIPTHPDTIKVTSMLQSCGLVQHVREPTHVLGHTLDVIITRDTDKSVSNITVVDPGLSDNKSGKVTKDHYAVIFNTAAEKPAPIRKTVTYRKLNSIDIDCFKSDIESSELSYENLECTDPEQLVGLYTNVLSSLLEKHAPLQTKTIVLRPSCAWYTQELHDEKHLRRKLERKWQRSKLTVDHEIYRSQCAKFNNILVEAKTNYYSDKVVSCGRDQKQLFQITNNLLNGAAETSLPTNIDTDKLPQKFSDFFVKKIEMIRDEIKSKLVLNPVESKTEQLTIENSLANFDTVSEDELKKIINKSSNKSCELDPIPTWLLKSCLDELLPFLSNIINISLNTGKVPSEFKRSYVRPLLKKQTLDQNTLKNYRPVSNLSFVSKTLERVVSSRIDEHLTMNHLQEKHQSAYRKFHSTETALIKVQNDVLKSLDHGNVTVLVMLDLSAAFDTIDHTTLLQRLEHVFGIADKPLEWITSYLLDRTQTVYIDGVLSNPVTLNFSVPQGSVLGPKFYTMYTQPLGAICKEHGLLYHLYADDSQLYLSFKPLDVISKNETLQRIQSCLRNIISWMNTNMLKLNTDKTEVIIFSSQQNSKHIEDLSILVGDSAIEISYSVRNLGAIFDSNMNMEDHVNSVCRSCYAHLRQIGRIRKYLTLDATKQLVTSLVISRLDYCNALLYGVSQTLINKLQIVQNTAARIITRTKRYDHITPVLKQLHWLPVQHRIQFKILTHTYKALNGKSPEYIEEMLCVYKPRRNLRSQNSSLTLVIPKSKTVTYGDRRFDYAAPKLWNNLPSGVRDSSSLCSFKRALKTHYFKQAYE